MRRSRVRLGLVCNEVFAEDIVPRYGGFGWLTREIITLFRQHPELSVDVVAILPAGQPDNGRIHGAPAVVLHPDRDRQPSRLQVAAALARQRLDLVLCVDYRPEYNFVLKSLPRTPVVLWVQDPWTPSDIEEALSLVIPGHEDEEPVGFDAGGWGMSQFGAAHRRRKRLRPHDIFAISAPSLAPKTAAAFDIDQPRTFTFLPYPIPPVAEPIRKSPAPTVSLLGRLDPIKRPWMLVEIARLLPDVTFRVMGTPNWTGPGTWQPPDDLPGNVEMLGHVDGRRKQQLLAESWILVSCALHEGLPVSYVEALAYENVLVACQDPDAVVSQFGRYVGQWPSSGLAAVSAFADAIRELIDQDDQRRRLARRGAQWAQQNHCYRSFLKGFANICETLQIGWDVSIDEFE